MAIRQSLKIIVALGLIANLFVSFYPKRIELECNSAQGHPVKDHAFAIVKPSNDCFVSENNFQKEIDAHPQKIMTLGKLHTKSSCNHFELLILKKSILQNELIFNLPQICFKFPLSEHTEEG